MTHHNNYSSSQFYLSAFARLAFARLAFVRLAFPRTTLAHCFAFPVDTMMSLCRMARDTAESTELYFVTLLTLLC